MKFLRTVRNYLLYCGIEKDEYNAVKKDAYVSNFAVWRVLHCLMTFIFAVLFINSLYVDIMITNRPFYLVGLIYSAVTTVLFLFVLKKDSLIAQLVIYLSISMLFLLGAFITQNLPDAPAVTFIMILIITPMFMIDKPYFMAIELCAASVIYLVWMRGVKPYEVWRVDLANIIIFAAVALFLHIIANSLRIKEFVLTRRVNIQKDTDYLTGLNNRGAVTRQINEYLTDKEKDKGIMFLFDIDRFKSINDTFGHDTGDEIIKSFGALLKDTFNNGEIIGRFGGDEFIVFIKNTDDHDYADKAAQAIVDKAAETIIMPDGKQSLSISIGIAMYHGAENHYSEIFKKADVALYKTKSDRTVHYNFYNEAETV